MKKVKQIVSVMLCLLMLVAVVPVMDLGLKAEAMSLSAFNERLEKFKNEVYGEGTTYDDSTNGSTYGWECFGFANYLTRYIFGSFPCSIDNADTVNSNWSITRKNAGINNLCIGDIIRYYNTTGNYHSIVVTGIDGDTINFCDANRIGKNTITYNGSYSRSYLSGRLTMGNAEERCWIAHWKEGVDSEAPVNLGDDFWAYLGNQGCGKWVAGQGNNVQGEACTGDINQMWHFIRQENGSYCILCLSNSYAMNVSNASSTAGANLQLAPYVASKEQQFYIYIKDSAYYFKVAYANLWVDMDQSTFNIAMWNESSDYGPQKYNIQKIDYKGYLPQNIGTDFYAIIKNSSTGKWLTDRNYNVQGEDAACAYNQIWHFVRHGDRCYSMLCNTTNAMDISHGSSTAGSNLQIMPYVANAAQRFYIYYKDGGYYFKSSYTDLMIDMDQSDFNVAMWNCDMNSPAHKFEIIKVSKDFTHTWNSGTVIKEATANEEGIIRYTCITCGATKDVSVAALQPTSITVDLSRVKQSYYVGESLNTSGLKLSATYSDGTTETVTEGFTCTPSELTTTGTQTVTVNYAGKTCTYVVNVKLEEPAPYWGDLNGDKRIDDSDTLIVNQYLKGYVELSDEQKCFSDVIFDGRVNASDYTKMVRYAKGYENDPVSSNPDIRLTTTKSSYNIGDTLESENFRIVVSSTDGADVSYIIADGFTLSGYDANKTGTQTISTTFRGLELSTTITVAKAEHIHSYTSSITKAATCSTTGIRTFTCSCGDSYTETIPVNASNHVNKTNVAATASTCTVKGYTAGVYCNDCKQYISGHAEQPLAAHKTATQNAKAATCTAEGYTGDQVCTVCKQTITKGTAIAKKAHTLTTVNQKSAGCTTAGYTGDQYCTTCKQTITKGSAVAALGHANADSKGNCTRCGQHIKDVTPSQPSNPQPNPNACKYCGQVHSGPFGWLIKFFHSILAIFKR